MNWDQVWDMNVYLFFNYLKFDIEYRKQEEADLKRWQMSH